MRLDLEIFSKISSQYLLEELEELVVVGELVALGLGRFVPGHRRRLGEMVCK